MPLLTACAGLGNERRVPPKIGRLARLAAAGLPVPPAVVFAPDEDAPADADLAAAAALLASGPVIVRTALGDEDAVGSSFAGLGPFVADVSTPVELRRTIERLGRNGPGEDVRAYAAARGLPDPGLPWIFVQRRIVRRHLYVACTLPDDACYVERFAGDEAHLADGTTPNAAFVATPGQGGIEGRLAALAVRVAAVLPGAPHGLEIEMCEGHDGTLYVVQARPLSARIVDEAGAFLAEVERRGQRDLLVGLRVLDAEHNPEPVSFAHEALIDRLRRRRPDAGDPVVLAGWLYVAVAPRDLPGTRARGIDPRRVLGDLRTRWIPEHQRAIADLERQVAGADAPAIAKALPRALDLFDAMIDRYLDVLVPARRAAPRPAAARPTGALEGREAFAHVLPVTWDVASPTLGASAKSFNIVPTWKTIPDADLATHLAEWDDHLFALGLHAVRVVYLHAARRLGLAEPDVFCLRPDELAEALRRGRVDADRIAERRADLERARSLRPPLRLYDATPLPPPAGRPLSGIGIGAPARGVACVRSNLADLLDGPPADPGRSVVILPALVAQASVALARLRIGAVVAEHGGALSHGVVLARELGLSALVGCRGATEIPDGTEVEIDTVLGRLRIVGR